MNCNRYDRLLVEALDAPLDPAQQSELDAHLASCPRCVERMTEYVVAAQLLRELGASEELEVAPPLPEHLVARILALGQTAAGDKTRSRTG